MQVAVIGAGINGVCIAWELARAGHGVTVFERDRAMAHTSSASTKLLHGGLRYLENGEFRLVRESLLERRAWFDDAPAFARPLRLLLPVFKTARRSAWTVNLGLHLYDLLALGSGLPRHTRLTREDVLKEAPELRSNDLLGAFAFWDGQMDDRLLGLWAVEQATQVGATFRADTEVVSVEQTGGVGLKDGTAEAFDAVINAAGPWAADLLKQSHIPSEHRLDLVRGSHLVLNRPTMNAFLLEVPGEKRIFFVLPWKGKTLVGTTEERQAAPTAAVPSEQEVRYLLNAYNHFFEAAVCRDDISESFSGLRPLIQSASNPSLATREYVLERKNKLITVFGGKWTTSRALARKVKQLAEQI
jgi:glycerol-3-phosphate dehydrogenase